MSVPIPTSDETERRIIAASRPVVRLCGAVGLIVITFLWIVVPISDEGGYRSFPGYMLALTLMGTALIGACTARIEVEGEILRLVDVLTVRELCRARIDHVDGQNGVVVVTRGGQRLESVAFGSSVLQHAVQSRRYAHAGERIQEWVEAGTQSAILPAAGEDGGRHSATRDLRIEGIVRRPRQLLTRGVPAAFVATQVLGVVLWLASPVLLPIVTWHGRG